MLRWIPQHLFVGQSSGFEDILFALTAKAHLLVADHLFPFDGARRSDARLFHHFLDIHGRRPPKPI